MRDEAALLRDLGHPIRLQVLLILARDGRQCVCRMLPELGVPQPTLSRHLAIMRSHRLIEDARQGTMVFYRIIDSRIPRLLSALGFAPSPREELHRIQPPGVPPGQIRQSARRT